MDTDRRIVVPTVVNGVAQTLRVLPEELLIDTLRDDLGLTGVKRSCDVEICGSCTVLLDGDAVSACTTLAAEASNASIHTVEGLASEDRLSVLQEAFITESAMQCGFCTPGFLMAATALLAENPNPGRDDVADYLDGNICRCGGYNNIVAAVLRAASEIEPPDMGQHGESADRESGIRGR